MAKAKSAPVKSRPHNRKSGAENSARKRRQGGKGKPFELSNEHAFKPGQSGNPGGRPKGISEAYRQWLEQERPDGTTNAMDIAVAVGARALGGDLGAVEEMREATEGKAVQPLAGIGPSMSDARERLAHLVVAFAARSGAGGVDGQSQ